MIEEFHACRIIVRKNISNLHTVLNIILIERTNQMRFYNMKVVFDKFHENKEILIRKIQIVKMSRKNGR